MIRTRGEENASTSRRYQVRAHRLIDYETLRRKLREWAKSPLVRVEDVGVSGEGRRIPLVIVGDEARSRPSQPMGISRTRVLFCGGAFGFEAAHVEAQAQLIDRVLDARGPFAELLNRLEILVMPMPNPDGRIAAIRQWRKQHLTPGFAGCGNASGFVLNRDFFTLSQPETRAIHEAWHRYHPSVVVDSHEDMFSLGIRFREKCWCPPFRRPHHPLLPKRTIQQIDRLGAAVAAAWRSDGYDVLHDPTGREGVLSLFKIGGRLHLAMGFHGVPTLVTESARTPGVQTWQARVTQKVTAYLAVLASVAAEPERFRYVRPRVQSATTGWLLTSLTGDALSTLFLLDLLGRHGVHSALVDSRKGTYMIPAAQQEVRMARALLDGARWNTAALPPAFGVQVRRLRDALTPHRASVVQTPRIRIPVTRKKKGSDCYAIPNSLWGIALANRAMRRGIDAYQVTLGVRVGRVQVPAGTIVLRSADRERIRRVLAGEIGRLRGQTGFGDLPVARLRRVKVVLYAGQGVDEQHTVHLAEARHALQTMGFAYTEIAAPEVTNASLRGFDVLLVPGGRAQEIVEGWDPAAFAHRLPWRTPGRSVGIGQRGLAAIVEFVRKGGGYLGMGSGGGVLACTDLRLVTAEVVAEHMGEGIAYVRTAALLHPVARGLRPVFPAYYYSEPLWDIWGAAAFRAKGRARSIARYVRPRSWRTDDPVALQRVATLVSGADAIVSQEVGDGRAVIMGISPNFRASWPSTIPLLSNALWYLSRCTHESLS